MGGTIYSTLPVCAITLAMIYLFDLSLRYSPSCCIFCSIGLVELFSVFCHVTLPVLRTQDILHVRRSTRDGISNQCCHTGSMIETR